MSTIVRRLDPDLRLLVHILRVGSTYFRIVIWTNWFCMDFKLLRKLSWKMRSKFIKQNNRLTIRNVEIGIIGLNHPFQ